jgi:hypothetical protein
MEKKEYPNGIRKLILSYLAGWDLFHKISLLSKSMRDDLPKSGLLEQFKVITIKQSLPNSYIAPASFSYALKLADAI